jgi:hypothetical protein
MDRNRISPAFPALANISLPAGFGEKADACDPAMSETGTLVAQPRHALISASFVSIRAI